MSQGTHADKAAGINIANILSIRYSAIHFNFLPNEDQPAAILVWNIYKLKKLTMLVISWETNYSLILVNCSIISNVKL